MRSTVFSKPFPWFPRIHPAPACSQLTERDHSVILGREIASQLAIFPQNRNLGPGQRVHASHRTHIPPIRRPISLAKLPQQGSTDLNRASVRPAHPQGGRGKGLRPTGAWMRRATAVSRHTLHFQLNRHNRRIGRAYNAPSECAQSPASSRQATMAPTGRNPNGPRR